VQKAVQKGRAVVVLRVTRSMRCIVEVLLGARKRHPHLWTTPLECRECRPRAMSSAIRLPFTAQVYLPSSSEFMARRRSPPWRQQTPDSPFGTGCACKQSEPFWSDGGYDADGGQGKREIDEPRSAPLPTWRCLGCSGPGKRHSTAGNTSPVRQCNMQVAACSQDTPGR
jgi:hypothetical protein